MADKLTKKIKRLKNRVRVLEDADVTKSLLLARARWELAQAKNEAGVWRARAEALQNTPEVKADTEAAFNRGVDHQRRQFAAWLHQQYLYLSMEPLKHNNVEED